VVLDDLQYGVRSKIFVVVNVWFHSNARIFAYSLRRFLVERELHIGFSEANFFEAGSRIAMEERRVELRSEKLLRNGIFDF